MLAHLATSWLWTTPLRADSTFREASLLDAEVALVVESCRLLFSEAWEESGGFGGHGGAAMEAGQVALDLPSLLDQAAKTLADNLDPPTRAALLAFAESSAGARHAWLSRELASSGGQGDLLRHGRTVHGRLPPERIASIEAVDRAIGGTVMDRQIAQAMVGIVGRAAAQISALTGEVAEWDLPEAKVSARLQELAAERGIVRLTYRLNGMDDTELGALLDWAESSAGQAFHTARRHALLGAVDAVSEQFAQAQHAAIDVELAEYRREREREDGDEGEGGDDESGRR